MPAERLTANDSEMVVAYDYLNRRVRQVAYVWGPGSDGRLAGLNSLLGGRDIDGTTNYVSFNNGSGRCPECGSAITPEEGTG